MIYGSSILPPRNGHGWLATKHPGPSLAQAAGAKRECTAGWRFRSRETFREPARTRPRGPTPMEIFGCSVGEVSTLLAAWAPSMIFGSSSLQRGCGHGWAVVTPLLMVCQGRESTVTTVFLPRLTCREREPLQLVSRICTGIFGSSAARVLMQSATTIC